MLDTVKQKSTIHACFDRVEFDLWCEDEWMDFKDKNYFYEPELLYAFLHFVRPGDVCIDAGANLGYHSLFLSRLIGRKGTVLALEPDPAHFQRLLANIELNDVHNIVPFPNALWSQAGEFDFWSVEGGGYSSFARFINFSPSKIKVDAVRLDDFIKSDFKIRLIKIDCEGAEEQILHGGQNVLRNTDCVILEFNFGIMGAFGSTDRSIRNFMAERGFDCFVLRRDGKEPFPLPPDMPIKMEGRKPHMINVLFARKGVYEVKTA